MKLNKKIFAIGIVSSLLVSGISFSYVSNLMVDVNAQMDFKTKLIYNGKIYDELNSKNEAIRPLVFDGVIYLPESIVEETAKLNIDYNENKNELYIGEKSEKIYFSEKEFFPKSDDGIDRLKNLYYTENPKELFVNNRMFKTALKVKPDVYKTSDYYFNTIEARDKVNVIGGSIYVDKSVKLENIKILFRNSNGEGAKVLAYLDVKPGEILDFEIDTQGSDIIIMDTDNLLNSKLTNYVREGVVLDNLSFFDLYYK